MHKFFLLMLFGFLYHLAHSQRIPAPTLSVGLETVIPTRDMSTISSFGLGASMKTITPFASFAGATTSAGYTHYFGKKDYGYKFSSFNTILMKGGVVLFTKNGFYVEPQVGYALIFSKTNDGERAFVYAMHVGCRVKHFDVSIKSESIKKYEMNYASAGLRIAYVF